MVRRLTDRARLIGGYVRRQKRNNPGPSALMVETTVRCNLLCPMCPRTGAGYPNEDMPDDLLWALLEEFARLGGDHIYLYGLGEPLMDARIFELLARCRDLGVGTVLSTNGTFLNERRRSALLESGCDHLLVGLDGASAETYGYYRKGGKYDRVVDNLRDLGREKVEGGYEMTIVVQFIRMKRNAHEVQAFTDLWHGAPGIDLARIKSEDIGLEEHRTYEVDGHLRANPCHFLWRGPMLVRWNGDVFACYHHAEHGTPVGNLAESSVAQLWDSEKMVALRTIHGEGKPADDACCATCPAPRPRLPLVLGAMALSGTTVRKLVPVAERLALTFPSLVSEKRESRL